MIKFNIVRYKNFLSSGNVFTEINLSKNSTTLIIGDNGAGKSTLLDALTFGLFGKPFRNINKPQLVNTINEKNAVVEIEFQIGSKNVLVRRGIKPNIFEIQLNGKQLEQDANIRDFQELLEKQILKLNYKSFTQIVVLGNSSFVPFMQLKPMDRRAIIEDLLDIQIFSTMNNILKNYSAETKLLLDSNKHAFDINDNKIVLKRQYIETLKNRTKSLIEKYENDISSNVKEKDNLLEEMSTLNESVSSLFETINDLPEVQGKHDKLQQYKQAIQRNVGQENTTIEFLENHDDCPTCKQDIAHRFKHEQIESKQKKIKEFSEAIQELEKQIKAISERLQSIQQVQESIQQQQTKVQSINNSISAIDQYISKINGQIKDLEVEQGDITKEKAELKDIQNEKASIESERKELVNEQELHNYAKTILKDEGIKSKIIKQYLPVMNKLINKYLSQMNFFVSFNLDESFNEKILSRFRDDFTYDSFSEGEKMRIDLALLFTWRAVAKLKNSVNTNLLILDEVFDSSLDNDGTDEFMKIVNEQGSNNNVFVISHKGDTLYDKFRSVIKFDKRKNFSVMIT